MKPTHESFFISDARVTAWQFSRTAPIPVWVAKRFHQIDETGWHGIAKDGSIVKAEPTNWAVVIEDNIIVLTDVEFTQNFRLLP